MRLGLRLLLGLRNLLGGTRPHLPELGLGGLLRLTDTRLRGGLGLGLHLFSPCLGLFGAALGLPGLLADLFGARTRLLRLLRSLRGAGLRGLGCRLGRRRPPLQLLGAGLGGVGAGLGVLGFLLGLRAAELEIKHLRVELGGAVLTGLKLLLRSLEFLAAGLCLGFELTALLGQGLEARLQVLRLFRQPGLFLLGRGEVLAGSREFLPSGLALLPRLLRFAAGGFTLGPGGAQFALHGADFGTQRLDLRPQLVGLGNGGHGVAVEQQKRCQARRADRHAREHRHDGRRLLGPQPEPAQVLAARFLGDGVGGVGHHARKHHHEGQKQPQHASVASPLRARSRRRGNDAGRPRPARTARGCRRTGSARRTSGTHGRSAQSFRARCGR